MNDPYKTPLGFRCVDAKCPGGHKTHFEFYGPDLTHADLVGLYCRCSDSNYCPVHAIDACENCGSLKPEMPCCPDKKIIDAKTLVHKLWKLLYADDGTLAVLKIAEQELATVEREIRGLTPEAQSKALPKIRELLKAVRS